MSVALTPWDVSNHETQPCLIIVIILVVLMWPTIGTTAAIYSDAAALASLLIAAGSANAPQGNLRK
jgi:hypothetical protein